MYGKAIKVIHLNALQKRAAKPFPNMTAPIYLNGILAAIVKIDPYAIPENRPNGKQTMKQTQ